MEESGIGSCFEVGWQVTLNHIGCRIIRLAKVIFYQCKNSNRSIPFKLTISAKHGGNIHTNLFPLDTLPVTKHRSQSLSATSSAIDVVTTN